jgi:hypothetical protein
MEPEPPLPYSQDAARGIYSKAVKSLEPYCLPNGLLQHTFWLNVPIYHLPMYSILLDFVTTGIQIQKLPHYVIFTIILLLLQSYYGRSNTLLSVRLSDDHYYAQRLRSDTKFHIHAELIAALQLKKKNTKCSGLYIRHLDVNRLYKHTQICYTFCGSKTYSKWQLDVEYVMNIQNEQYKNDASISNTIFECYTWFIILYTADNKVTGPNHF